MSDPRPTRHFTDHRIQTVCLLILASVAGGFALHWLSPVLVPFTLALFFAYGLSPLVDYQTRRLRWPRWVGLASTALLGILLFIGVIPVITTSVDQLKSNSKRYEAAFEEASTNVVSGLRAWGLMPKAEPKTGETSGQEPKAAPSTGDPAGAKEKEKARAKEVKAAIDALLPPEKISAWAADLATAVQDVLSNGLFVLIFMMFLLIGGSGGHAPVGTIWHEVEAKVQRYIATKVIVSGFTGVLVFVTLTILGVDLAIVFALLTFLLNFIPNIGSVIAVLLPLPVVLVSEEMGVTAKWLAILIPLGLQFVVGNVIEPRMMGESFDLHPITILISLVFWSMLWGIVGMFLSVPITAIVKILLERLELTAPVARLMAGRLGPPTDDGASAANHVE